MTRSTATKDIDPPVTIVEDEADDDYEANHSSWNASSSAQFVSPKCDKLVQSFNQELDHLAKSCDEALILQQRSFAPTTNVRSRDDYSLPTTNLNKTPSGHSHHSTSISSVPWGIKDPPASAYRRSTPARSKQPRPGTTPEEPPPEPVQTPVFPTFGTPAASRYRRNEEKEGDGVRRRYGIPRHVDELTPSSVEAATSWEASIENMVRTLSRQEERIQLLERENEELRQKLNIENEESKLRNHEESPPRRRGQWEEGKSSQRQYHRGESGSRREDAYRTYHEDVGDYGKGPMMNSNYKEKAGDPRGRLNAASSVASSFRTYPSPGRIRSPPRRIHTGSVTTFGESAFSPGTCFVGELARLMQMEKGHHAPLSMIIDKHWDQLKHALDSDRGYD